MTYSLRALLALNSMTLRWCIVDKKIEQNGKAKRSLLLSEENSDVFSTLPLPFWQDY